MESKGILHRGTRKTELDFEGDLITDFSLSLANINLTDYHYCSVCIQVLKVKIWVFYQ